MSDETRETQGEVVVPEGFIVLHADSDGKPLLVRADAIDSFYPQYTDQPERGSYVQTRSNETWRVVEWTDDIARLIAEAQGGTGGEAEKVLAWLQGATDGEERAVSLSGGVCCATIYPAPGGMIRRIGATYLAAIAAAEAER